MKLFSLRTKTICIVSLTMATTLCVMSFIAFRYFENEFRKTVAQHQFSMVSAIAEQLDNKIATAQEAINAVARTLDPDFLTSPKKTEVYLQRQSVALTIFDNGLFLFSMSGKILAGTLVEPQMREQTFLHREYFQQTVRTGKPYISEPFTSVQKHNHQIIMLTTPIIDETGVTRAILAGSLDLSKKNFFGALADLRIGNNGRLSLLSRDGTLIFHPNRDLLLDKINQDDAGPLLMSVFAGFEGSGEHVDPQGLPLLSSFKRLGTTGWVLASDFPKSEADTPIARAQSYFMAGMLGLLVLSILISNALIKTLTKPLEKITSRAQQISKGSTDLPPFRISSRDEIGSLAKAFNRMLSNLERQKNTIKEQKELAEALLKNSASAIFVIDAAHKVIAWNRACEELTGIPSAEMLGTDRHWQAFYEEQRPCLADSVVDEDWENISLLYGSHSQAQLVENGLHAEGWRSTPKKGQRYLLFSAVPICDDEGRIIAAIETLEDYTDRKEVEKKMSHLAHFDQLTGLPNRVLFFDRLEQTLRETSRYEQALALLFLDLNGFKEINDNLGHDVGDQALVEVAKRLKSCVRDCDTVARMGGDEFTVILTRIKGADDAADTAKRILDALSMPVLLEKRSFLVGASIGISMYPEHGEDADNLVKNADTAMYAVKPQGKSQYCFFSSN